MGTIRERLGKTGKSYHCQVRRNGATPVTKSFRTKAEGQRWVRMVEAEIDAGTFVNRKAAEGTTLRSALERYKANITPRKKGAEAEVSLINTLCQVGIARRSLASLRSSDFAALRDQWIDEGYKPATVVRRLQMLSHLFTICRTEWNFEALYNPIRDVAKPKVNNGRERLVERGDEEWDEDDGDTEKELDSGEKDDSNPADREAVLDEIEHIAAATRSPVLRTAMRFAAMTALRRSEIAGLAWSRVNLKAGTVHIPKTKNGTARTPVISPEACALLESIASPRDGRVFPVRADALTRAFIRARDRARKSYVERCAEKGVAPSETFLVGLRFHDLRHEATTMLARYFPMEDLAKITGHKTTSMLLRYYHPKVKDLAKKFPAFPRKT